MELLAPAGHWEAMVAAVQNGANAVYLGCGELNARRGAKNFSQEELPRAVAYCHVRGVKVYLTVNTLTSDRELPIAAELLRQASRWGVDAVIVQDWGLAALAREIVPDLPPHGSTQMTVHSLAGARRAAELGMERVVLARELSREDIRLICRSSPVPVEVFAHGALCMCWSGQCAMSALIGQRSGNRGLCAQPCRLPYRLDGGPAGHPLSLKDMSLTSHLRELRDMGVASLTLEGRMKRPEYVAVVTGIYARLLAEDRLPTAEELEQLALAFSREGFTEGYWRGETGPEMFGVRSESARAPEELFRGVKAAYEKENLRTVPVTLAAELRRDRPCRLTAWDREGRRAEAAGPAPEAARSRPLEPEDVKARLSKTGGTAFRASEVRLELEEGLALSAGAINGLRREALEQLALLRAAPPERRENGASPLPPAEPAGELAFTVSLARGEQLTKALLDLGPRVVYLPAERIEAFSLASFLNREIEFCAELPRICKDREEPALLRLLEQARERGCTSLAVQNLGQLALADRLGLPARGDFALNLFNSRSLAEAKRWGLLSAAVSLELRWEQIRDLRRPLPCEALVYGRLPLMVAENCLVSNAAGGCAAKNLQGPCAKAHSLTDRRGEVFPLLSVFGCRTEIENSRVLFLADKPELRRCGLRFARLRFTTETPEVCVRMLARYMGQNGDTAENYTRGLFYRGVE